MKKLFFIFLLSIQAYLHTSQSTETQIVWHKQQTRFTAKLNGEKWRKIGSYHIVYSKKGRPPEEATVKHLCTLWVNKKTRKESFSFQSCPSTDEPIELEILIHPEIEEVREGPQIYIANEYVEHLIEHNKTVELPDDIEELIGILSNLANDIIEYKELMGKQKTALNVIRISERKCFEPRNETYVITPTAPNPFLLDNVYTKIQDMLDKQKQNSTP